MWRIYRKKGGLYQILKNYVSKGVFNSKYDQLIGFADQDKKNQGVEYSLTL